MGFFAKVWSGVKKLTKAVIETGKTVGAKTYAGAKKTVEYIAEKVDEYIIQPIKKGIAKVSGAITGKTTFEEAEALYQKIENNYNQERKKYEQEMKILNQNIDNKILSINNFKGHVYQKSFANFMSLANRLHNLQIEGKELIEYFQDDFTKRKSEAHLRNKKEIFTIDFNNLTFKECAIGILTAGWSTRKAAKQSLENVKVEENRVKEEIQKMQTHLTQIKSVLKSLDNVESYFDQIIASYEKLLKRFEYGISTQTQKALLDGQILHNGKLNFKQMPIKHIEDFHALFNLSIILKKMSNMNYLSEDGSVDKNDHKAINAYKKMTLSYVNAA
jgi:Skp family chaperone for outer membrane proteins